MTDIHAAIGRVQLTKVDAWTAQRRRRTPRSSTRTSSGVVVPPVADGRRARLPPVHDPRRRGPRRLRRARCKTSTRSAAASTTRSRTTGCRRSRRTRRASTCPRPSAPRARSSRCPVHPSLTQGDLERIVDRRERRRRGGRLMAALRAGLLGVGMMGRHHARVLRERRRRRARRDRRPGRRPARRRRRARRSCPTSTRSSTPASTSPSSRCRPRFHEDAALTLADGRRAHPRREADRALDRGRPAHGRRLRERRARRRRRPHRALQPRAAGAAPPASRTATLGEVYQIATRRQGPFPSRIADVGVAKDLASHDIDLTAWVAQSDYATVCAQTTFKSGREHEDMIAITGRLANGVIVNHLVNWLSPMKERVTIVTGEKGAFVADTLDRRPHVLRERHDPARVGVRVGVPRRLRGRRHPVRVREARAAPRRARGVPRRRARASRATSSRWSRACARSRSSRPRSMRRAPRMPSPSNDAHHCRHADLPP